MLLKCLKSVFTNYRYQRTHVHIHGYWNVVKFKGNFERFRLPTADQVHRVFHIALVGGINSVSLFFCIPGLLMTQCCQVSLFVAVLTFVVLVTTLLVVGLSRCGVSLRDDHFPNCHFRLCLSTHATVAPSWLLFAAGADTDIAKGEG